MSCKNKSARTEIICLKRPSALDKVTESIPKPKGAVPNFGLPKWKVIPLESKIPMVPAPKGAYNFSRRKLGKKLWVDSSDAEFNISDPYNYEMELQYDGFHDPYLTDFYKRPNNIKRMIKLGFVSENLDAKCSLKDYNMYRKYLKKLHNDSVNKELNRKAELFIERKEIMFGEEKVKRDMERLKKMETAGNCKEKEEKRNKMRKKRLQFMIRKFKDRIKRIEEKRKEDVLKRIEKKKEKVEKMSQVHEMAAKLERARLVQTLTDWKRKERERKKLRKIRLKKEEQERKQFIHDRWLKKQQFQLQELEREKFLKRCLEQERQMFMQEYNKKIEKERQRMQNLLNQSKKQVKCYTGRFVSKGRRRICCKIPKFHQEEGKKSNPELKSSAKVQTKILHKNSKNLGRINVGDKKRGKKLQTRPQKTKTWQKKPQEKKTIPTPETNGSVESEEFETISCPELISEDDLKSKCECEKVKFLKRYEIPDIFSRLNQK